MLSCCSKVFHWTHEMPPDQKRPLDTYYDSDRGRLASYQLEVSQSNLSHKEGEGCWRKTAFFISVFYTREHFWKWPRVLRYRPLWMLCIKQQAKLFLSFFLNYTRFQTLSAYMTWTCPQAFCRWFRPLTSREAWTCFLLGFILTIRSHSCWSVQRGVAKSKSYTCFSF